MKHKGFICLLVVCLLAGPSLALNQAQEFDITFWQTLPFAVFWGHLAERQISAYLLPGSATHWNAIGLFALVVSVGNALVHSSKVMSEQQGVN